MTLIEMEGFLRGKCVPRDMLVNESNAQYLVRKFAELEKQRDGLVAEAGAKAIRDCAESLLANDDIGVEHEYPLMLSYAEKLRGGGV